MRVTLILEFPASYCQGDCTCLLAIFFFSLMILCEIALTTADPAITWPGNSICGEHFYSTSNVLDLLTL